MVHLGYGVASSFPDCKRRWAGSVALESGDKATTPSTQSSDPVIDLR